MATPHKKIKKTGDQKMITPSDSSKDLEGDVGFPVVGIGASAGGLEAISALLTSIPADTKMAIVIIQHLDPYHHSLLPELIGRKVSMPVMEASNNLYLEPHHIYVIPPNKTLTIAYGKFTLEPRKDEKKPHMAIDAFLKSLAQEKKHQAIGVILSGTGNDGTDGLREIKAEGGITFAQSQETAQYFTMPESAIKQGVADFVFSPQEIAQELVRILKQSPYILGSIEKMGKHFFDREGIQRNLFSHLRMVTGVDFSGYKPATVNRRVARRMILQKIDNLTDYVHYLGDHKEEVTALFNDLLILVTSFFRDPEVFQSIYLTVLPAIIKKNKSDVLRIWVPGCSTGEEVYSLCILICEYLEKEKLEIPIQIFATDLSKSAIEFARRGIYSELSVKNIDQKRLQRFFTHVDNGWKINKKIREMCVFAKHDITSEAPYSKINILSCRNLLIYLNSHVQEKVLQIFHYSLCPEGFLILGGSETTGPCPSLFEAIDKKHRIYRRKNIKPPLRVEFQTTFMADQSTPKMAPPTVKESGHITKEVEKILLKRHVYPTILVDSRLRILEFYGEVGTYLDPTAGTANLTLRNMVSQGLVVELQALLSAAKSKGKTVKSKETIVQFEGDIKKLYLEVTPLKENYPSEGSEYFLIVIRELEKPFEVTTPTTAGTEKSETLELVEYLKNELAATKETLLSVIEEREASNEELQSYNEELQSINEEMETAKEELQSTNEELTTLNDELHNKNEELNIANSDLVNFFSSVNVPFVLLDRSLRIRRFTSFAKKTLNLIEGDIGRPFSDSRISAESGVLPLIKDSLETLSQKEMDIKGMDNHWYSLRVRPYRDFNDHIDGVVLAFIDITELRKAIEEEKASRLYIEAIFDTVREPIMILNRKLHVQKANDAFYQFFKTTAGKVIDHSFFEIDNGQWNISSLKKLLEEMLAGKLKHEDFRVALNIAGLGKMTLSVNLRRLSSSSTKDPLILLAIHINVNHLKEGKNDANTSKRQIRKSTA